MQRFHYVLAAVAVYLALYIGEFRLKAGFMPESIAIDVRYIFVAVAAVPATLIGLRWLGTLIRLSRRRHTIPAQMLVAAGMIWLGTFISIPINQPSPGDFGRQMLLSLTYGLACVALAAFVSGANARFYRDHPDSVH